MPPRDSADTFDTGIALRDNRGLDLRWPVPSLAFAREDLEPLRALAHRIITRDYHRSSALSPNQVAQTPRWASPTQGGARTALAFGGQVNRGKFRTPSLRNVALTGPWWHDGSAQSLDEAINRHGFAYGSTETASLMAFLDALSDLEFKQQRSLGLPTTACGKAL